MPRTRRFFFILRWICTRTWMTTGMSSFSYSAHLLGSFIEIIQIDVLSPCLLCSLRPPQIRLGFLVAKEKLPRKLIRSFFRVFRQGHNSTICGLALTFHLIIENFPLILATWFSPIKSTFTQSVDCH
jgi:hypothetical protein